MERQVPNVLKLLKVTCQPGACVVDHWDELRAKWVAANPEAWAEPAKKDEGAIWIAFEAFWRVYPRKEAKLDARKAWKQLKPTAPLQQVILAALEWQVTQPDWTKDHGQWIPRPAAYLRQGRYLDERRVVQNSAPWWHACKHRPVCETLQWHKLRIAKET